MKLLSNIRLTAVMAALMMSFLCNAQTDVFRQQLTACSKDINTIVCDFTQTSCMAVLANEVNKTGEFCCQKPGNILLAFDDGDFIKLTDKSFSLRSSGKTIQKNISSNPMLKELKKILSACMTGNLDAISAGFTMDVRDAGKNYEVTLTPIKDRAMSMIKDIEMVFDKSDMSLSILKMNEPSGDYVKYLFTNKRFNTPLKDDLFN